MTEQSDPTNPIGAYILLPYDPAGYSNADGYLVECPKCYAVTRQTSAEAHAQRCPARDL